MRESFKNWEPPEIEEGKPTRWNWVVQHVTNLSLGKLTDIGAFTYINARHGVQIGDKVQIGSHCSIYSISTIDNRKGPVKIMENARIGSHSVVLPNVTIGKNVVIGAFSLVNNDIPDGVLAYGQPCRVIKYLDED